MFKRILVPLDGSGRAERALPVAARVAHALGCSITLLQVVDTAPGHTPVVPTNPVVSHSASEDDRRQAASYLMGVAQSELLRGIAVDPLVMFGQVAPLILATTRTHAIDLVILCSHGFSGMTRWMLGSVAEKVAHHSEVPVFILREKALISTGQELERDTALRVIVPLDGSDYALATLPPAVHLAAALAGPVQSTIELLHVTTPEEEVTAVQQSSSEHAGTKLVGQQQARYYLDTQIEHIRNGLFAPSLQNLHVQYEAAVVAAKDVAGAIVHEAESHSNETGNTVVAIATHGHSGMNHWVTGSVPGRVMQATMAPLLIVRPGNLPGSSL